MRVVTAKPSARAWLSVRPTSTTCGSVNITCARLPASRAINSSSPSLRPRARAAITSATITAWYWEIWDSIARPVVSPIAYNQAPSTPTACRWLSTSTKSPPRSPTVSKPRPPVLTNRPAARYDFVDFYTLIAKCGCNGSAGDRA